MNITGITIAYNGYGKFLPKWIKSFKNQTIQPKELIVVLSENHQAPELKGVKIIHQPKRLSMGELWNLAIKEAKTEWILKLDADDFLLPHTIEKLQEVDADVILMSYCFQDAVRRTPRPDVKNYNNWRTIYDGPSGYMSFKKTVNGKEILCQDTDFPNFPLMMYLDYLGAKFEEIFEPCAVYKKNLKGHSYLLSEKEREKAWEVIKHYANLYKTRSSDI